MKDCVKNDSIKLQEHSDDVLLIAMITVVGIEWNNARNKNKISLSLTSTYKHK